MPGMAVAGVGVLIIAPFVVPGLSPIAPTSVLSEQDAGQPAPAEESGEDTAGAGAAEEAAGSPAPACSYPALVEGEAPADGADRKAAP